MSATHVAATEGERPISPAMATVLVAAVLVLLVAAWWFPQNVLARTPLVDITPLEVAVAVGAVLLLATRAWRWIRRPDAGWAALFAAYLGWFVLAAVLRGDLADLKPMAAFVVFAGVPAGVAFAALRADPGAAPRRLIVGLAAAVAVAAAAALLERVTYVGTAMPDPLEPFWRLFRPANTYVDPQLGPLGPPPLHFPLDARKIRVTGLFFHTNYMAFFGILVAPLMTALTLRSWRLGRRGLTVATAAALGVATVSTYWTYSRAGLVGLLAAIALAAMVHVAWEWRSRWPLRRCLVPAAAVLLGVGVVLGGTTVTDDVGLRRLLATEVGDPLVTETPTEPGVEGSAARAAMLRYRLQRVALEAVTASPRSLALGAGLGRYADAIHDPSSPTRIEEATGIRDPNSLWLSVGLGGGATGVVLLVGVLAVAWSRLLRSLDRRGDPWRTAAVIWVAAWIPSWAVIQLVGTNPFTPAEAIIFGVMMGVAGGLSLRRSAAPLSAGPGDPAGS
jgi:hypothetical protein